MAAMQHLAAVLVEFVERVHIHYGQEDTHVEEEEFYRTKLGKHELDIDQGNDGVGPVAPIHLQVECVPWWLLHSCYTSEVADFPRKQKSGRSPSDPALPGQ